MNLSILRVGEAIIFELGPEPAGFFKLIVSNSLEERMWTVMPFRVEATPIIQADMFLGGPVELASAAMSTLKKISDSGCSGYPPVSRVVYGKAPEGYREITEARPLLRGEKYCVIVFGEGIDITGDFFFA